MNPLRWPHTGAGSALHPPIRITGDTSEGRGSLCTGASQKERRAALVVSRWEEARPGPFMTGCFGWSRLVPGPAAGAGSVASEMCFYAGHCPQPTTANHRAGLLWAGTTTQETGWGLGSAMEDRSLAGLGHARASETDSGIPVHRVAAGSGEWRVRGCGGTGVRGAGRTG